MGGLIAVLAAALASVGVCEETVKLRVMSYNIHSAKGRDGKVRPDRIAEVIRAHAPDFVALQEVRVGRVEPGGVDRPASQGPGVIPPPVGEPPLPPPEVIAPRRSTDAASAAPFSHQPRAIAEALGMYYAFYPLVRLKDEDYGIAVLSRLPIKIVRASNLPTKPERAAAERRGALWVELEIGGVRVQLVNTHLGLSMAERADQVEALASEEWLKSERFSPPFVVIGDFNSRPSDLAYKRLSEFGFDAAEAGGGARKTFPSVLPLFRIDHVFASKDARALASEVPRSPLTRTASDHLPVVVDLEFPRPGK